MNQDILELAEMLDSLHIDSGEVIQALQGAEEQAIQALEHIDSNPAGFVEEPVVQALVDVILKSNNPALESLSLQVMAGLIKKSIELNLYTAVFNTPGVKALVEAIVKLNKGVTKKTQASPYNTHYYSLLALIYWGYGVVLTNTQEPQTLQNKVVKLFERAEAEVYPVYSGLGALLKQLKNSIDET